MKVLTKEEKINFAKMFVEVAVKQNQKFEVQYIQIVDMWILFVDDTVLVDELSEVEAYNLLEELNGLMEKEKKKGKSIWKKLRG